MRLRFVPCFFFMIISFGTQAQNWLQNMVAQKTLQTTHISKSPANFFDEHEVILFYGSHCPHCHQFAPIVKNWAENNKAGVLPISFDNQPLPSFQNFIPVTKEWISLAFQDKPIQYPALFITSSKNKSLYPVAFGALSFDELDGRVQVLIPKIRAYEQRRSR